MNDANTTPSLDNAHVTTTAAPTLVIVSGMSGSGKSVTAALRYWKIEPEEMLVAHDELDLPYGVVRAKCGGGEGGHNGLRSINASLAAAKAVAPMD